MQRRVFVGSAFAGLAAAPASEAQVRDVKPGDVPRRVFGKTGERLSVIGQAGGRFHLAGFEDAKSITRRAYDLGINYFDTAHLYWDGKSEEVYGAVLPEFRKSIFLTTKSANRSKAGAAAELDLSLKRLKTDYLDLWQIHQVGEMKEVDEIFGPNGAIEAFEAAKMAGKARFIGFTGHHDPAVHLEMLKRYDKYDTILMPLHIADPLYLSFEKQVLPVAVQRGMGIQGMKSTANAKLLQRFSAKQCLTYTLSLPIHCLAVGCTTIGQIEDDVRIVKAFAPYSGDEMAALQKQANGIKGPGLEDWKRDTQRAAAGLPPRAYVGG